ncbi:hypothetical protein [Saccharopolyspora shandongensis]|uniref:hypothetical protein n=1 Tax=Saccharopolyspora shandongensis TaxID=418495 RepID=UPI0033E762C6
MKKDACFYPRCRGCQRRCPRHTAFADSADNDGVNILNDNNVSIAPTQVCGADATGTGTGAVQRLRSPQTNKCVNAPPVDHPSAKD